MSTRRDWRNAWLAGKRTVSVLDEKEYRAKDGAARWLERREAQKSSRRKQKAQ